MDRKISCYLNTHYSSQFLDLTEKSIVVASCTLSKAGMKYFKIEKEALGLNFSVTKFNEYFQKLVYHLLNDHKHHIKIFELRNKS